MWMSNILSSFGYGAREKVHLVSRGGPKIFPHPIQVLGWQSIVMTIFAIVNVSAAVIIMAPFAISGMASPMDEGQDLGWSHP
jgi:hypothetical protein